MEPPRAQPSCPAKRVGRGLDAGKLCGVAASRWALPLGLQGPIKDVGKAYLISPQTRGGWWKGGFFRIPNKVLLAS